MMASPASNAATLGALIKNRQVLAKMLGHNSHVHKYLLNKGGKE